MGPVKRNTAFSHLASDREEIVAWARQTLLDKPAVAPGPWNSLLLIDAGGK